MSGLELPTATGAAWVVWTPLTTGDLMMGVLGMAALTVAVVGLLMMRRASIDRNRQLDALDRRVEQQGDTLAALVRGLETVIERTAPGGEAA